jgi:hypothetical protein
MQRVGIVIAIDSAWLPLWLKLSRPCLHAQRRVLDRRIMHPPIWRGVGAPEQHWSRRPSLGRLAGDRPCDAQATKSAMRH